MYYGLASPTIKVYDSDKISRNLINSESWVLKNACYPYGIRGLTEEEIIRFQHEGHGIFEICCSGHIFILPRKVIKGGIRFKLAPIETALAVERDLNNLGLKMYCDSYVYIKHISVDGKIYCNGITQIKGLGAPHVSTVFQKAYVDEPNSDEEQFIKFLAKLISRELSITPRPQDNSSTYDEVSRRIITDKDWDEIYGKWKPIMDKPERYKEIQKRASEMAKTI
jgi:hypothetical protein